MEITIIGAGSIGSVIARELVSRDAVHSVRVCDSHTRALQELDRLVRNPKLRAFQVDARDSRALAPIISDSDCIVGAMGPALSPMLAELALQTGSHYCDLGGGEQVMNAELALASRAVAAGKWIVPSCGLAPGLINVMCMYGVSQFDTVESALLRAGDIPIDPQPPFNFHISWSAEKLIDDYSSPAYVIEDGSVKALKPMTDLEDIHFDAPFSFLEAFHTAGSLSLLARELEGRVKTLDHKTIRWPGHASQMSFLLGLGLGEPRSIDVRTHLTYRDVLVRRMRQRLGGEYRDAVLLRVAIHGKKDGQERTLRFEMVEQFDDEAGITAMKRCTAVPAAAVAYLLASGGLKGSGAAPPERVVPHKEYLEDVKAQGLNIRTAWQDGHVSISEPLPIDTE